MVAHWEVVVTIQITSSTLKAKLSQCFGVSCSCSFDSAFDRCGTANCSFATWIQTAIQPQVGLSAGLNDIQMAALTRSLCVSNELITTPLTNDDHCWSPLELQQAVLVEVLSGSWDGLELSCRAARPGSNPGPAERHLSSLTRAAR
jgi:hypothetical protein